MSKNMVPLNSNFCLVETTKKCEGLNYNSVEVKCNGKTIHIGNYITGYNYPVDEQLLYNEYAVAIVYEKGTPDFTIGTLYDITTESFVNDPDEANKRFDNYFNKENKVNCITQ